MAMAVLHGRSPPPFTFVTGDLNFPPKIWSRSVVYGLDPFKDAHKRPIPTIPPSITTTHHDGGLPSPLSWPLLMTTLPSPLPPLNVWGKIWGNGFYFEVMVGQNGRLCSLQTNWKLNKDQECWTKLEKQYRKTHGPFLFDTDDDDQDIACWDERIEQRWNVEVSQHAKEMDMSPYSPSPSTQQLRSCAKTSAQRKQSKTRTKKTGKSVSCNVGSGEI